MVYPKTNENYKAISAADDAIKLDPQNEKAFFRRGTARMAGNDLELAISDFKKVVEVNKVGFSRLKNSSITNIFLIISIKSGNLYKTVNYNGLCVFVI